MRMGMETGQIPDKRVASILKKGGRSCSILMSMICYHKIVLAVPVDNRARAN